MDTSTGAFSRERGADPNSYTGLTVFYPIVFTPPSQFDTLPVFEFYAAIRADGGLKLGRKTIVVVQAYDGRVWFAHSDEYTIFERTLEGDTGRSFSIPSRPARLPTTEMDSVIRAAAAQGRTLTRDDRVTHRRLVTRVLTDNAGHVYAFPQEDGLPEGMAVDVFRDTGEYLGRMQFSEKILILGPPPYITTEHIYAVVPDEFDVPFVVRWRIVRP